MHPSMTELSAELLWY